MLDFGGVISPMNMEGIFQPCHGTVSLSTVHQLEVSAVLELSESLKMQVIDGKLEITWLEWLERSGSKGYDIFDAKNTLKIDPFGSTPNLHSSSSLGSIF